MTDSLFAQTCRQPFVRRVWAACGVVSDGQLLTFCIVWVVTGGLMLQLIVLPYVFPFAHAGHGLIAGVDAPGYHATSVEQAERIRQQGWSAWWLIRGGITDYVVALSSVLYLIYPEPWIILPINGLLFGIGIVAVRRVLGLICDSRPAALAALLPFFFFPSFVVIWGQPVKDLNTGVGLSLVLYALVGAAWSPNSGLLGTARWAAVAAAAMGLTWVSRPYALALMAAATVPFVAVAFLGRQCQRIRLAVVAVVVIAAALSGSKVPKPGPVMPSDVQSRDASPNSTRPASAVSLASFGLPQTRTVDPSTRTIAAARAGNFQNCLPSPDNSISAALYALCYSREGYIHDALEVSAGSGYDYDIRLRSAEDFVAYAPRAVAVALLEPGPWRWRTEQTPVGKLGSLFVPFEMIVAYLSFVSVVILAGSRLARPQIWAVVGFCVSYILFYVVATPQMGTLYRMRAFAFAIVVSTALAIVLAKAERGALRNEPER